MSGDRPPPPPVDLDETLLSGPVVVDSAPASDQRAPALVIISHPDRRQLGRRFEIPADGMLVIGRAPGADIYFPDLRQLSRRHARIESSSEGVTCEDLGSKNGTFVDGLPIEGRYVLENGARLELEGVVLKYFDGDHVEHAYHESIYDLVMRDELTSVYNRRKFEEELERDFARSVRYHRPLALIIFDVDGLKDINDQYGHPCGDQVLRRVAETVDNSLRREGIFARIGGDEFVALCPEVTINGGWALARRIQKLVAGLEFEEAGGSFSVTCSFGVAEVTPEMSSAAELYRDADTMLYRAKEAGGNRVVVAG